MTLFHHLPHELNRMIGSYLDPESRISFNRILPDIQDRFVQKLSSDERLSFHMCVLTEKIRSQLDSIDSIAEKPRILRVLHLIKTLAMSKDLMQDQFSYKFQRAILNKVKDLQDPLHQIGHKKSWSKKLQNQSKIAEKRQSKNLAKFAHSSFPSFHFQKAFLQNRVQKDGWWASASE